MVPMVNCFLLYRFLGVDRPAIPCLERSYRARIFVLVQLFNAGLFPFLIGAPPIPFPLNLPFFPPHLFLLYHLLYHPPYHFVGSLLLISYNTWLKGMGHRSLAGSLQRNYTFDYRRSLLFCLGHFNGTFLMKYNANTLAPWLFELSMSCCIIDCTVTPQLHLSCLNCVMVWCYGMVSLPFAK